MRIAIVIALGLAVAGFKGCEAPKGPAAVSEACAVLSATLWRGGSFRLSAAEVDALSQENQVKLAAAKKFWRDNHCAARQNR
jgi:hypothetical protein